MSATESLVSARLPACLSTIAIDYFGRINVLYEMAQYGQYEDCQKYMRGHECLFMQGACRGGHLAIAELAIANGANDLNSFMITACAYDQLDIIKYLLTKSDDLFNLGLRAACRSGHSHIAEFMIASGATEINLGLYFACSRRRTNVIRLMISHGADHCSYCQRSMENHLVTLAESAVGR